VFLLDSNLRLSEFWCVHGRKLNKLGQPSIITTPEKSGGVMWSGAIQITLNLRSEVVADQPCNAQVSCNHTKGRILF
jgi:hypothetical protein